MARQRLTLYLLQDVERPADALDADQAPSVVALAPASGLDGTFYWTFRPPTPPAWVSYMSPVLSAVPANLKSSSASGLLVFKSRNCYFAATFGYARGLLDQSKVVRQFGLRVVLNTIDPRQIRSLDTKTFEDMVVARTTQASRSTSLPVFGVDVSRDILRAATGEPHDPRYGKRVSGADAIVLNLDGPVTDLPSICADLLDAHAATAYKQSFSWIDDLAIVEEPTTIEALDEALVAQLRERDTSSTHLAMPDTLNWEDIDAFKIAGTRGVEYDELDLDTYLKDLPDDDVANLSVGRLKGRRVSVSFSRSSGDWDAKWSVYHSLVSEQKTATGMYVLIEGRWFEVSKTLAESVDTFISKIERAPLALLPSVQGEKEGDYNRRLADADQSGRIRLDAKILNPEGAASGLEFCDVLTSTGVLIHVKRKSRSSTLSHLFAQGVVSATALIGDGQFRNKIRAKMLEANRTPGVWDQVVPDSSEAPDRGAYTVSYVVITNSTKTDNTWLPFFSRLNLMLQARALANLGIRYTLDRVAVEPEPTGDTPES